MKTFLKALIWLALAYVGTVAVLAFLPTLQS